MDIAALVVLALSGLMLTGVGVMRLVKPLGSYCLQTYQATDGADLVNDRDMLSEMRGAGTLTLLVGLTVLAGAALPEVRPTSLAVAALFFLGFGVGRAISMGLDGKPNGDLVNGTVAEFVLGGLNLALLVLLLS